MVNGHHSSEFLHSAQAQSIHRMPSMTWPSADQGHFLLSTQVDSIN